MSFADEVRRIFNNASPMRKQVGGHSFPSVGVQESDKIPRLETAVAALATAIEAIANRVDELERRGSG